MQIAGTARASLVALRFRSDVGFLGARPVSHARLHISAVATASAFATLPAYFKLLLAALNILKSALIGQTLSSPHPIIARRAPEQTPHARRANRIGTAAAA